MRRFKNILAVYGDGIGADDVFCQAVALAGENDARLTFIDVLPERYATEAAVIERRKRLERLVPAVKAEGVNDVETLVFSGTPFLHIIRQVLRANYDLVIASADGGASLRNVYFGSTATHLMRKCPSPVWIVKPGQSAQYSSILACVDPKPDGKSAHKMDKMILDLSTSLAEANSAKLHVVHAWEVEGKDRDTISSEVRDETRDALLHKHEEIHRQRVQELLAPYQLDTIDSYLHLPRSTPQNAIVSLVDEENIDLIVMGTVSRTGIPGLIIGNAAETILSVVQCGVLTIKPEGFVTPVVPEDTLATV